MIFIAASLHEAPIKPRTNKYLCLFLKLECGFSDPPRPTNRRGSGGLKTARLAHGSLFEGGCETIGFPVMKSDGPDLLMKLAAALMPAHPRPDQLDGGL